MDKKDIFERINNSEDRFSKGQKKLAEYIKNAFEKAQRMTAYELGDAAGVSESTVVRFATSLGYDGYPQMQKDLAAATLNKMNSMQRMEMAKRSLDEAGLLSTVMQSDAAKIKETLSSISEADFRNAVDSICIARKIYVIGVRSSAPLASFLAFYLNVMFEDVILLESGSPGDLFEQMIHMDVRDVLLAISFPRYSIKTQRACEYAAKCKAKVITISDSTTSPLAAYSDSMLVAKSQAVSIVDSLVAPLSVINALLAAISLKKQGEVRETFARLESLWEKNDFYNQENL